MEENCDSGLVPSLTTVAENIYSSCECNTEKNDEVFASSLIEFMRPHMSNHPSEIAELQLVLDPKDENPLISRNEFYEAMRKWTAKMNGGDTKLSNFSFRESDAADEKDLPFHQSTPKPSLAPSSVQNFSNILNFSNVSSTSLSCNAKSNCTVGCDKLFLEEKVKELEHKYMNALSELSLVKSQLEVSEGQYHELRMDFDRTNKRLMLEQQVNADLQKSMEHNDDYKEEVLTTKKEIDHLQRMWSLAKKENNTLIASMKELEFEKEQFERKINEMRKKDDVKKKELSDLHATVALIEEENKTLKKLKDDLKEKLEEQTSLVKHFTEVSEIMKNENHTLRAMIKKNGVMDPNDLSKLKNLPKLPVLGKPSSSPKTPILKTIPVLESTTPFKNMYHPTIFNREIFNSPKFLRQLTSPISPDGLDTPTNIQKVGPSACSCLNQLNRSERVVSPKGVICIPERVQLGNIALSDCSKNSSPVKSSEDSADGDDTPRASTADSASETLEDLDLSVDSENVGPKDLLSELQACKFLDNRDKCFVEDHTEWLKIVKEHENCSKIISEYQQRIELLAKDIESVETEHNNLLAKYKNMEKDAEGLEIYLNDTKTKNDQLVKENSNLTQEIESLNNRLDIRDKELHEMYNLKIKSEELLKQIDKLSQEKESKCQEHNALLKDYDSMVNDKQSLENQLEKVKNEKENLFFENNNLCIKNNNLNKTIDLKDKELHEMRYLRDKNEELEKEVLNMKNEQEKNCREVEKLTKKLEQCNDIGQNFVDMIKKKLIDQNTKVQFLRDFNKKLEEYVQELQTEVEITKSKFYLLKASKEETSIIEKSVVQEDMQEHSTSTEGSETNLVTGRPEFKKRSNYVRRSNYEKQQFKINKLEEQTEFLQKELWSEKAKSQKLCLLEFQLNNLELEKVGLEEEKSSILRELEATKYDLSLKTLMMEQFEEKNKFQLENLKESFKKEKELINLALMEAQKEGRKNRETFEEELKHLGKSLNDCKQEKKCLEKLLEKQETKIIGLKKALSDVTTSSEEVKAFENLVSEKDSMLKFNRELLAKSNSTLQSAENRILSLELLLNKCGMVLKTADDVFSSTKMVFEVWKNILKDEKIVDDLKSLETDEKSVSFELTEQEIWKIHNQLIFTSQLLKALARKPENGCPFCKKELTPIKSISKFTLRPSKLQLHRLPSSDPDISSSCAKDETDNSEKNQITVKEVKCFKGEEELITNNSLGPEIRLKENESITDWLGPHSNSIREALNNRTVTEKKFGILASTWKSNYEKTKTKYSNFKHQCSKLRDAYLRTLLQIVTYLKNHKCQQEQQSLIQALKLVEKLKDLIFDVFKLAEQCGASRQEVHSMKCWNLIVEYVNGLHRENEQLKLFRCTSVQMITGSLHLKDISTETDSSKKSLKSSTDGDLDINEIPKDKIALVRPHKFSISRMLFRKCSTFGMMMFSMICFLAMFLLYLHVECVRNGNRSIVCPLDFLVSVKKASSGFPPH